MPSTLTANHAHQFRLAADFLERLALTAEELEVSVPVPTVDSTSIDFSFYVWDHPMSAYGEGQNEDTRALLTVERFKQVARAIGGRWEKNDPKASYFDDQNYVFTHVSLIGTAKIRLIMSRDLVCERVQVGTKTVVKPAVEAQPEREVEEPIYERECKPLFARAEAELDKAMAEVNELEGPDEVLEGELQDA